MEERREQAEPRRKAIQERVAKASNARVKLKDITVRDLVLKLTKLGSRRPEGGAFGQKWEGSFRVIEEERKGVYRLQDAEGNKLSNSYHSEALNC